MSNYSSLKATINANVKTNGNQEITGLIMNSVLNAMTDALGAGYQYIGVATPSNPGTNQTPDYRCFYIATTPGTYTHLGGLVVNDGEVAILKYDSSWHKDVTGAATAAQVAELSKKVSEYSNKFLTADDTWFASHIKELFIQENLVALSDIKTIEARIVQNSLTQKYYAYLRFRDASNTNILQLQSDLYDTAADILSNRGVVFATRNQVDTQFQADLPTAYAVAIMDDATINTPATNVTLYDSVYDLDQSPTIENLVLFGARNYRAQSLNDYTIVTASYVNNDGVLSSDRSATQAARTEPIAVKKGDRVKTYTYEFTNCAAIAFCEDSTITSSTKFLPLTKSSVNQATIKLNHCIVPKDGYIVVSFHPQYNNRYRWMSIIECDAYADILRESGVYIPSVSPSGDLSWSNNMLLPNPATINIKGPQGEQGQQGIPGPQGNSGYTGAAGELEVVNNTTDGGATAALSAEQGKLLAREVGYNNVPLNPRLVDVPVLNRGSMTPSDWTAASGCTITSEPGVWDEVYNRSIDCVKLTIPASANDNAKNFRTPLASAMNLSDCVVRLGYAIPINANPHLYGDIYLILYSGGVVADSNLCRIILRSAEYGDGAMDDQPGWCFVNMNANIRNGSKGSSFDITNITHIGIAFSRRTGETGEINLYVSHLDIVAKMNKPGVCICVDNFASAVVPMAQYAYENGVRLSLSVIPNWIGNPGQATLDQIHACAKQGHLIWNHTWNHITNQAETLLEVFDGVQKAENWMIRNGFSRGAKILSNPSDYYDANRYKAQFGSDMKTIYHHWSKLPTQNVANDNYLLYYPYFPATRQLNLSSLDLNTSDDTKLAYFIECVSKAGQYGGIAVMGFHGDFWSQDGSGTGARWKSFIDAVVASGLYTYTIDEIVEGSFI